MSAAAIAAAPVVVVVVVPTKRYSVMALPRNVVQVETPEMVLFWELPSVFCQWLESEFQLDGVQYMCAEQYMMAEKAKLFGDEATRAKILASRDPERHQQLGREAKNFDNDAWQANCFDIVVRGNRAKFSQNAHLLELMRATGQRELVEASEVDRTWGIGLAPDDKLALDKKNWLGRNLLGEALMVVRRELCGSSGL